MRRRSIHAFTQLLQPASARRARVRAPTEPPPRCGAHLQGVGAGRVVLGLQLAQQLASAVLHAVLVQRVQVELVELSGLAGRKGSGRKPHGDRRKSLLFAVPTHCATRPLRSCRHARKLCSPWRGPGGRSRCRLELCRRAQGVSIGRRESTRLLCNAQAPDRASGAHPAASRPATREPPGKRGARRGGQTGVAPDSARVPLLRLRRRRPVRALQPAAAPPVAAYRVGQPERAAGVCRLGRNRLLGAACGLALRGGAHDQRAAGAGSGLHAAHGERDMRSESSVPKRGFSHFHHPPRGVLLLLQRAALCSAVLAKRRCAA